jgi:hypothetical protein
MRAGLLIFVLLWAVHQTEASLSRIVIAPERERERDRERERERQTERERERERSFKLILT